MKRTFNPYPQRREIIVNGQIIRCYRFEAEVIQALAALLEPLEAAFSYEAFSIPYERPARKTHYKPDIQLSNGVIIEVKGEFSTTDRQKHLLIKQQHPALDIRFVFQNSRRRISRQSKTTYALWCDTHGFLYADKRIPPEWL